MENSTEIHYKVFLSFCGADKDLKNTIKDKLIFYANEDLNFSLDIIEMDTHCTGDWGEWMIRAVEESQCVIPIITDHVLHSQVEKRVYEEVVEARNKGIVRIPFIVSKDAELPPSFRANLNGCSEVRVNVTLSDLDAKIKELYLKIKNTLKYQGLEKEEQDIIPSYLEISQEDSFIGREQDMQEMKEMFETSNVIVLHGQGGIGKTCLAKNFFLKNKDLYSKAYILSAPNGIKDTIGNLQLNHVYTYTNNIEERYKDNLNHLSKLSEKVIIIMDNCDCGLDLEELNHIRNLHCKFIITSRPGDEKIPFCKQVGPMTEEELLHLVYKNYPSIAEENQLTIEETNAKLKQLFVSAGGHTLTIEMATAIMNSGDISIDEMKDKLLEVTETCRTAHTNKKNTILERLSTLYNLADCSEEEKNILHAMVLISPINGIKRKELKQVLNLLDNNAINHLIETTLLRFNPISKIVSLHPLFSDVLYKNEKIARRDTKDEVILDWIINYPTSDNLGKTKNFKIEYLEYLYNKRKDILLGNKRKYISFLQILSNLYKDTSDIASAIEVFKVALDLYQEEEKDLSVLAKMHTELGWLYLNNSLYDSALEELNTALFIHKEQLSKDKSYVGVSEAYNNLGVLCKDIGKFEEAEKYYKMALSEKEKEFEAYPLHPSVAKIYNNLGYLYREMGKYSMALDYVKKALDIQQQFYKDTPNPLEIALTYNILGLISRDNKEYALAEEYYLKSLDIRQRVYEDNPNHFDMATIYNNLGVLYMDFGRYELSLDYLKKSLEIKKIIYKQNEFHPWIANTYANLGRVYLKLNHLDMAEEHLKKSLEIRSIVYKKNPTHPLLALNKFYLGQVYYLKKQYEQALKYLLEAERIYLQLPKNENLMGVYAYLSEVYKALGNHLMAEDYAIQANMK